MAANFRIGAIFDVIDRSQRQFNNFLGNIRRLRLEFLGLEMAALVLNRVGKSFARMGQSVFQAIGANLGPAVEFDDSVTRLGAVSGFTGSQISLLSDRFIELSSTLPLSAQQLAEVGIEAVKAGVKSQGAIEQVSLAASKLAAVSSDLSEAQAAKGIIAISTQFGVSADDMEGNALKLADAFATFKDAGIGTAGELANITKRFGAQARAIGLTQEQAIALAATTRALGIQTEVAGTSLSQLIIKLSSETERFANASGVQTKELKSLLDRKDGMGGLAALQKVLIGLNEKSAGSTTELAKSLKSLGIRGARPVSVLLGLSQNMDTFNRIMGLTKQTTGVLNKQFDTFAGSFKKQLDTLRGSLQNVAISFGRVLKPVIVAAIQVVLPFLELLTKIPGPVKLLIGLTAILAGTILFIAGGLAVTVAALAGTAISFIFLTRVVRSFRNTLARQLMPALRGYRSALHNEIIKPNAKAAASFGLIKNLVPKPFRESLEGAFISISNIAGLLTGAGGMTGGLAAAKAGLLAFAIPLAKVVGIAVLVIAALAALKPDIEDLGAAFGELFAPIGELISGLGEIVGITSSGGLLNVGLTLLRIGLFQLVIGFRVLAFGIRIVAAFFRALVGALLIGLAPLRETFARIGLVIQNLMEGFSILAERFGMTGENGSFLTMVLKALEQAFFALLTPLIVVLRVLAFVFEVIVAFIVGIVEGVMREMEPVFEDFRQIFAEIGSVFAELEAAFQPLLDAFGELFEALGLGSGDFDTFGIIVQATAAAVRFGLQIIIVPLRILTNVMKLLVYVTTGLFKLFISPWIKIAQALAPVVRMLAAAFKAVFSGSTALQRLSDGLKHAYEDIGEFASAVGRWFIEPFVMAADAVKSAFDVVFQAIKTGFGFVMDAVLLPLQMMIKATNLLIDGLNAINVFEGVTGSIPKLPVPSFDNGGLTRKGGLAVLDADEAVMPIKTIPQLVSSVALQAPAVSEPRRAVAAGPSSTGGGETRVEITVPVTLMLDGSVLGRAMVKVGDEEIRRQFGMRGVRLAGI